MIKHWKPAAVAACIAVIAIDSVFNPEHRTFALWLALIGFATIYRLVGSTRPA